MRPVEMTGIVNRTTDYAQLKHSEDQKPIMDQANYQAQFDKRIEHNSETVIKKNDTEWKHEKFDAKEKGKNTYYNNRNKKEMKDKKDKKEEDGSNKPIRPMSFDVRI